MWRLMNHGSCPESSITSSSPFSPRSGRRSRCADRADFCVGYFNLRGWKQTRRLDRPLARRSLAAAAACSSGCSAFPATSCALPLRIGGGEEGIDNQTALRLKRRLAEEFRNAAHHRRAHRRRRGRPAPPRRPDPRPQGRRQAVPAPHAARQALPAPPHRPGQPDRRLPRLLQPHLLGPFLRRASSTSMC